MASTSITDIMHLAPPFLEDPYPFFERARREAPVFFSPIFHVWIVSRHQDVTTVLRDPTRFSSTEVLSPPNLPPEVQEILKSDYDAVYPLLASDPPAHTRVRALVSKAFLPQRIARLEPRLRELATSLIDAFVSEGQADLIERFAFPFPMGLIAEMFSVPIADVALIKKWCDDEALFMSAPLPLDRNIECARSVVAFRRYLRALVDEHARAPKDDLVSSLMEARVDGENPLSRAELVGLLCVLVFAGHETTTNMIGSVLLHLLRSPGRWEELRRSPSLIPAALEEGLRYDAPVQGMFRTTTQEVELGGVTLPKGARLFVVFASANRDEAAIASPDVLDIHRSEQNHLSFGRGIHFCMGAALARMEGRIALELLTQRLPGARLVTDEPPVYLANLMHRGPKRLCIAWDRPGEIKE